MVYTIGEFTIIHSKVINKDKMEELWKLVQNKERIIESQRDEIERLKAAMFHLKQENKELKEKVTSLTENDRCV